MRPRSVLAPLVLVTLLVAPGLAAPEERAVVDVTGVALPQPRAASAALWIDGAAFLFGGSSARTMGATGTATDEIVRFDPATMRAEVVARLPSPRWGAAAVWTGEHAYVVGGFTPTGATGEIVRFDPSTSEARAVLGALPPRGFASAVWTGREVVVFGGLARAANVEAVALPDLWAYDPADDLARPLAATFPSGRAGSAAVWMGQAAFVFGGEDSLFSSRREVYRYTPGNDSLAQVALLPVGLHGAAVVWDGARVRVLGGDSGAAPTAAAWSFDVGASTFAPLAPLPAARALAPGVWTGTHALLLGGVAGASRALDRGVAWHVDAPPAAFPRATGAAAAWTGSELLVFGEGESILRYRLDGSVAVAQSRLPAPRPGAAAFWAAGRAYVVAGGSDDLLRYDPANDTLATVGQLPGAAAAWSGAHAYVADAATRAVRRFDPATGDITHVATLPALGACCAAAGWSGGSALFLAPPYVHAYAPASGLVSTARGDVPAALAQSARGFDGYAFYALGGQDGAGAPGRDAARVPALGGAPTAGPALPLSAAGAAAAWTGSHWLLAGGAGEAAGRRLMVVAPWPEAPASLAATPRDDGVGLSWPASPGPYTVSSYRVYLVGAGGARTQLAETTARSFVDLAAPRNVTRTYDVVAVNAVSESAAARASAARLAAVPGAPEELRGSGPINEPNDLRWRAPADDGKDPIVAYRVYSATPTGPFYLAATLPANTFYWVDTSPQPGSVTRYYVTAVNGRGESAPSSTVAVLCNDHDR